MPYDFSSLFGNEDDEEDPNLTRRMRNPYMMNLYDGGEEAIDSTDPATISYMARAKEPLPSQAIYREYLSKRPQTEDYKSSILQKIGAGLLGAFGQGEAAKKLVHPGYEKAYGDWQTEGKYVPQIARGADVGRQRELEAERFGIIGTAKKRQFEETQRTNTASEEARKAKAEANAKTKAASEARAESREERATAAGERASKSLSLSESREARAEREAKGRSERELKAEQIKETERRTKSLEKEEQDIPTQVKREITSDPRYKHLFTRNEEGKIVPTEEGMSVKILDLIDSEINKRSMVSGIRHGRTY